jgi:hypothetical protein
MPTETDFSGAIRAPKGLATNDEKTQFSSEGSCESIRGRYIQLSKKNITGTVETLTLPSMIQIGIRMRVELLAKRSKICLWPVRVRD